MLVDSRAATLYPDSFVRRYEDACASLTSFEAWRAEVGFDAVLLSVRSRDCSALRDALVASDDWRLVWQDDVAVAMVRPERR